MSTTPIIPTIPTTPSITSVAAAMEKVSFIFSEAADLLRLYEPEGTVDKTAAHAILGSFDATERLMARARMAILRLASEVPTE
jgi:hypothetical protein